MSELQSLYATRFSEKDESKKNKLWIEICHYLKRFIPNDANIIVDVAAGYCDFINNIECGKSKYALDINPDVKRFALKEVNVFEGDVEDCIRGNFKDDSVSLFFMSNFLEHITKEKISSLLNEEYLKLKSGGGYLYLPQISSMLVVNTGISLTILHQLLKMRLLKSRSL